MCIRYQDKVTTAIAAGPCCLSRSNGPGSLSFATEQEREAKAQERERRKETRHAQMLATLQGSPMENPESWKGNF